MFTIDLNADVGEGIGNEKHLIPLLSSCNIACGAHAGSPIIFENTLLLAKSYKLKIGAHPGYPDKENFGRVVMDISENDLKQSLSRQLSMAFKIANKHGVNLNHIKAHGALYNQLLKNYNLAALFVEGVLEYSKSIKIYTPYNSALAEVCKKINLPIVFEGFADRNYGKNLNLISRKDSNALILKKEEILAHILPMIKENRVKAIDNCYQEIKVNTLCVHGDTENAIEILKYLRTKLTEHHVQIS
jgi:UPF0271 protein